MPNRKIGLNQSRAPANPEFDDRQLPQPNSPVEDINPYIVAICNLFVLLLSEVGEIDKVLSSMAGNPSDARLLAAGLDAHCRVTNLCERISQLAPPPSLGDVHAEILKSTHLVITWVSFLKEGWILVDNGQIEEGLSMIEQAQEANAAIKRQNMQVIQLLEEAEKQAKRKA